jgi:hypothetical protein
MDSLKQNLDMRVNRRNYYRNVFSTPDGQKVLKDLLAFCNMLNMTYVPGDPTTTAFNEGMRRVGLRIVSILENDPAKQQQLVQQQYNIEGF